MIVRPLAAGRCDGDKVFFIKNAATALKIGLSVHLLGRAHQSQRAIDNELDPICLLAQTLFLSEFSCRDTPAERRGIPIGRVR